MLSVSKKAGRTVLDNGTIDEITQTLKTDATTTNNENVGAAKVLDGGDNRDWTVPCGTGNDDLYRKQVLKVEAKRLAVLKDYKIFEDDLEKCTSEITKNLATKFDVRWAMISFVDMGKLLFKSVHKKDFGLDETCRSSSFCSHAVQCQDDMFVVSDAAEDNRFVDYEPVKEQPGVRFYAGVPLSVPEDVRLGMLCVMDDKPRPNGLTVDERKELQKKATELVELLVKRKDAFLKANIVESGHVERSGITPSSPRSTTIKHTIRPDGCDSLLVETKKSRTHSKSDCEELIPKPMLHVILPDPKTEGVDPDTYLAQLVDSLYGTKLVLKTALELGSYFPQITDEQMNAYSMEVVSMARTNNTEGLKSIFLEKGREALDCFNRFGEGLLNLCCRRGFTKSVEFLLSEEVSLSVRIRDDFGRTPLHDACWNPEPQVDICDKIMKQDPSLFLITDKRGYTPFQYARSTDWQLWRQFLLDRSHLLAPLAQPEIRNHFS